MPNFHRFDVDTWVGIMNRLLIYVETQNPTHSPHTQSAM